MLIVNSLILMKPALNIVVYIIRIIKIEQMKINDAQSKEKDIKLQDNSNLCFYYWAGSMSKLIATGKPASAVHIE